nr:retrotransposon-related protein [Tanacetum cinerariifolium]
MAVSTRNSLIDPTNSSSLVLDDATKRSMEEMANHISRLSLQNQQLGNGGPQLNHSRVAKIEFPKFSSDDVKGWVFRFTMAVSTRNSLIDPTNSSSLVLDDATKRFLVKTIAGMMEESLAPMRRSMEEMANHISRLSLQNQQLGNGGPQLNHSRVAKIEFPKFSSDDVKGWVFRCEQFFLIEQTLNLEKKDYNNVSVANSYKLEAIERVLRTNKESQAAFLQLKQAIVNAIVLRLLDFSKEFTLEIDASGVGLGAVLLQEGHLIAFLSKTLSAKHQLMSTYEKEFLAIVYALEK